MVCRTVGHGREKMSLGHGHPDLLTEALGHAWPGAARGPWGNPAGPRCSRLECPGEPSGTAGAALLRRTVLGKRWDAPVPIHFFSAGERFPRCVMGNDANMQTLSGIVPAQGEKLKHKSGGGKSRGGRLFKGDLAGLREPAAALPGTVLPGRAFPAGFQGVGMGKRESVWRGRSASPPWARPRDSERNHPPRWWAAGRGGWLLPCVPPALPPRPLRAEGSSGLLQRKVPRAAGVLGEDTLRPRPFPAPRPRLGWGGWAAPGLEALQAHTRGDGGSALGGGGGVGWWISPLTSPASPVTEWERVDSALEKAVGRPAGVCCL